MYKIEINGKNIQMDPKQSVIKSHITNGDNIIITDMKSGLAPKKLITKKINKDLLIFEEGIDEASVVLEDYYAEGNVVQLSGVSQSGSMLTYSVADGGFALAPVAEATAATATTVAAEMAGGGFLGSTASYVLGALGVAALAGGGGGGGSPSAPPADTLAPTVAIASDVETLKAGETATITFTFSEAPTGFTESDVAVTGGTLSNFTVTSDTKVYTATYTPTADTASAAASITIASGLFTDAAGNAGGAGTTPTIAIDTLAPILSSWSTHSSSKTVVLVYDSDLNTVNQPSPSDFTVTTDGVVNAVSNISVSGKTITLTLTDSFLATDIVNVKYTDIEGNTINAIQDTAGNDAASFNLMTAIVADGYISGAHIYIEKVDGSGKYDTGVATDANGNFFLPLNTPAGSIVAVGGTNTDTGIPNTMELKAPLGSTIINPLTTLVQAIIKSNPTVTVEQASASVVSSLGLTAGTNLTTYNPIAEDNVIMQKAAATVATVLSIATAGQDSVASQSISTSIIDSFVEKITTTTVPLNLGNPLIIGSIIDTASSTLGSLSTPIVLTNSIVSDIATASETIAKSLDIEGISASQKTAMDSTPNTAPWMTAPTLSSSSDTGFIGDGKSSDTTPEINFKTMTGVNLSYTVNDGASQTVSTSTTSESHAISLSELQEGNNTIIVTATSGEESTIRKITYNLDTLAPATIATSGFVITDTAGASATDLITSNPTIILTLASDTVSWQYSLDGTTFTNGTGNTITLADRSYQKQDIQVKQFDVAGNSSVSVMASPMVQLEALGNTTGYDHAPQITAVGTAGEYVVTFYGIDSAGDYSIFVQKFNANGTISGDMVQLEALGNTTGYDYNPQITAVGTAGEYVVTFCGDDSAGDRSIFVQKFNADGTISGDMVQLEALGNTTGDNYVPQITAVGTAGEYVVTFDGYDSAGDYSIFVQKFNANGTISGDMVQLEALGNTTGYDFSPQITAVGTAGEYVVTFYGIDSAG